MLKTRRSFGLGCEGWRIKIFWWIVGGWILLFLCWGCQQPSPQKVPPPPGAPESSSSAKAIFQRPKITFSTPSEGLLWEATAERAEGVEADQQGRLYRARVVFYKQGRPAWECWAGLLSLDGRRKLLRFLEKVSAKSFLQPASFQAQAVLWYANARYVKAWGGVRLQVDPIEVTGDTLIYRLDQHTWWVVGHPLLRWNPMRNRQAERGLQSLMKNHPPAESLSSNSMERSWREVLQRILCLIFPTFYLLNTHPIVLAQTSAPSQALRVGDLRIGAAGSIAGKTLKQGLQITARKNAWMTADGFRLNAPTITVLIPRGGPFDTLKAEGGIQLRYRKPSPSENAGSSSAELLVMGRSLTYQREKDLARVEGGVSVSADLESGGTVVGTAQRAEIQLQQKVAYLIGDVTLKFNDPQTFAEPGFLRGERLKINLNNGEWELLPAPGQQTEGNFKLKPSSREKEGSKE